jgi:hypothetical protein
LGEDEDARDGREREDRGDGVGGADGEDAEEVGGGNLVVVEGEEEELAPARAEVEEVAGEGGGADGERGGGREAGERGGVERGEGLEGGAGGRGLAGVWVRIRGSGAAPLLCFFTCCCHLQNIG